MYEQDGMTMRQIGHEVGLSRETIRLRLHALNVPVRSSQSYGLPNPRIETDADVRGLYEEDGLSTTQLAERFNVSRQVVDRWLDEAKATKRARGSSPRWDDAHLRSLYVHRQFPLSKVADETGYNRNTVALRLHDMGVPLDPDREQAVRDDRRLAELLNHASEDPARDLRCMYEQDGMTIHDIAQQLGCKDATARRWLRHIGVDVSSNASRQWQRQRTPPDPSAIRLYRDGHRITEVASRVGVSTGLVSRWLRDSGDTIRRTGGRRKRFSDDQLRDISQNGTLTVHDVAQRTGYNPEYLRSRLREIGISLRAG